MARFKRGFDSYVCEGDSLVTVIDGFTFTARLERDTDTTPHDYDGEGWVFDSAYPANREILAAWDRDEWHYFTLVIAASVGGVELGTVASMSGMEGNFPASVLGDRGNPNDHLTETANALLPEAVDHARARAEAALAGISEQKARRDALLVAFDVLTAYLVDHCPDGVMWEDFDGEVDHLRVLIDDEVQKRNQPG